MEHLLSKHPMLDAHFPHKCVRDYYLRYVEDADQFNIATGFISNDSIVGLSDLLHYRYEHDKKMKLNLLIGMNYLDRFTKIQYDAIKNLNAYLQDKQLGDIYISDRTYFHGKMYSFLKNGKCEAAFIGSSNLASFMGTSNDMIESDVFFNGNEAVLLNKRIETIIKAIGTNFDDIQEITDFQQPTFNLLNDISYVSKLSNSEVELLWQKVSGKKIEIPFKVGKKYEKSNLNPYFGKGKNKNKFNPRSWYEVELILSKNLPYRDDIPQNFIAITEDGYKFVCERQGDYLKNFRSAQDLKILGKWIKGHMEAEGCLQLREKVTSETLEKFGKTKLCLYPVPEENCWILKME